MNFVKKYYPALIMISASLLIWEGFVRITNQPIYILPAPTQIMDTLIAEREILLEHAVVTIYEALLGFGLALIIGVLLAIIVDSSSFLKRGFYPILVASQTIPIIALAPLIFIWFGFGLLPKVIVVALVAFFPIVINLIDGLDSADEGLISLIKTMNASKLQILLKIKLPSALPYLFAGLKISATYSLMGAVIGEWLGASKGLGIYMKNSSYAFMTDKVFAAILIIIAVSIAFYSILLFLEAKIIPWHKQKKYEE